MLSSINCRTLSSTNVTFCLESSTIKRRSGMTERGWSEEFNTRTGMNDVPSSLSEPIPDADSEEEARVGQERGATRALVLLPPPATTTRWIGFQALCAARFMET